MGTELRIRKADEKDVRGILALIRELAHFEEASHEVTITEDDLLKDGFGEKPRFRCLLAELNEQLVGLALFYERYSTWKGPTLYLEDLIVTEQMRGKGTGSELMKAVHGIAKKEGYKRLEWQVLDWNQSAISFYKKLGAEMDSEWMNCRIRLNEGI